MLARFFIGASVISLAVSLTGPGGEFLWGFLKPLSALLFGAFFITNLLAKEYAQYDEEHERRMELARKQPSVKDDNVSLPPVGERNGFVEGERSAEPKERDAVPLRDRC